MTQFHTDTHDLPWIYITNKVIIGCRQTDVAKFFIFIFCFSLEKWTKQREAKLEKQISTFSWRQPLPYLSRFSLIFLWCQFLRRDSITEITRK